MRNLVLGTLFGFLVAASVAFAYDVTFPARLKVQAHALVDELGNVLLGARPAKIEVTNMPDCSGAPAAQVLKDANGTTVGTILSGAPGASEVTVLRQIGGIGVTMVATQYDLSRTNGGNSNWYYESNNCSGSPYFVRGGDFYGTTFVVGSTLYYTGGPATARDLNSFRAPDDPSCTVRNNPSTLTHPIASLDLSQFVPPFSVQ